MKRILSTALLSLSLSTIAAQEDHKELIVHIVPHSYDAPFLKTIDDFFPWAQSELIQNHFSNVFEKVVDSLWSDPSRTFTHYETKYFSNWFLSQDDDYKSRTRQLIQRGSLEIVNGAWEMNDEVCPTYQDMILNIQKGHKFLWDQFQYRPRVAMSTGNSGHAMSHPRILAESGI